MTTSFGATTDHFGMTDTGVNLISSDNGKSGSIADCLDSEGDIVAQKPYDTGNTYEETLEVCQGKSATLKPLGTVVSSKVITSIKGDRSGTSRLKLTVGGENCPSADSVVRKFTVDVDSAVLAGGKGGLGIGIIVSKGRVISSSFSATAEVAKGLDSQGRQVCKDVYGAKIEASNELQSCDTAPAAIADTANGWILAPSGGGPKQVNTGYPTTTFNVIKKLAQDS
jgi:hypothetical protein